MEQIITFIVDSVAAMGYWGIILLMTIESSFVPFPSEVVMVPAGYLAYKGEMDFWLVVLCGTAGSLIGAFINYYLAIYVGRPFIKRYGKYFFIDNEKLFKVETFFQTHGPFSTFVGRLIPVVRQLVSVPAGLARMHIGKFAFYTSLGASIWMIVLTSLGYFVGQNEDLIKEYKLLVTVGVLVAIVCMIFVYVKRYRKKQQKTV